MQGRFPSDLIGARVTRGPNWDKDWDEQGGEGGIRGTITAKCNKSDGDQWYWVRWDDTGLEMNYPLGDQCDGDGIVLVSRPKDNQGEFFEGESDGAVME